MKSERISFGRCPVKEGNVQATFVRTSTEHRLQVASASIQKCPDERPNSLGDGLDMIKRNEDIVRS